MYVKATRQLKHIAICTEMTHMRFRAQRGNVVPSRVYSDHSVTEGITKISTSPNLKSYFLV